MQVKLAVLGTSLVLAQLFAFTALNSTHSSPAVPGIDAPELAALGPFPVGVRQVTIGDDQPIPVEVWYPAESTEDAEAATYVVTFPAVPGRSEPISYRVPGIAIRDAAPVAETFPGVVISHGFMGHEYQLSYLAENLASKGYIVAAVDHEDGPPLDPAALANAIAKRPGHQRAVFDWLKAGEGDIAVDPDQIALIGYSLGGLGGVVSAGADINTDGLLASMLPEGGSIFDADPLPIAAAVLIAPWGGQAQWQAWTGTELSSITAPLLFIAGSHDDVSGYTDGVRSLFDRTTGSDRLMLVFDNARHNLGGNPPPPEAATAFQLTEAFAEPVWRKDRIIAINQHFITAFLDSELKQDHAKRSYLELPTVRSNDGTWETPPGVPNDGSYAAGSGTTENYWRGFQRRWALGLELHRAEAKPTDISEQETN